MKLLSFLLFYLAKCTFPFPKIIEMRKQFLRNTDTQHADSSIKKSRHKELFTSLVIHK